MARVVQRRSPLTIRARGLIRRAGALPKKVADAHSERAGPEPVKTGLSGLQGRMGSDFTEGTVRDRAPLVWHSLRDTRADDAGRRGDSMRVLSRKRGIGWP